MPSPRTWAALLALPLQSLPRHEELTGKPRGGPIAARGRVGPRGGWAGRGTAPQLYLPGPTGGTSPHIHPPPPLRAPRAPQPHIGQGGLRPRLSPSATLPGRHPGAPPPQPPAPGGARPTAPIERALRPSPAPAAASSIYPRPVGTGQAPGLAGLTVRRLRPAPRWRDLAAAALGAQLRRRLYMAREGRAEGEDPPLPASQPPDCLPRTPERNTALWRPNGAGRGWRLIKRARTALCSVGAGEAERKRAEGESGGRRVFQAVARSPQEPQNGRGRVARANGCGASAFPRAASGPGTGARPGRPGPGGGGAGTRPGAARERERGVPMETTRGGAACGALPGKQPAVCLKTVTGRNPGWSQKAPVGCFPFSGVSQGESPRPRGNRHPCEGTLEQREGRLGVWRHLVCERCEVWASVAAQAAENILTEKLSQKSGRFQMVTRAGRSPRVAVQLRTAHRARKVL